MDVKLEETLAEARQRLQAHLDEGITCPCCGQFAKRYRRRFNSGMALSLIAIYKRGGRSDFEWVHIPDLHVSTRSREEGKIAYWKLLEEATLTREDGGRAGWWRVTPLGEKFVLNNLRIPKYIYIYNAMFIRYDGNIADRVTISECLGNKFDLSELMR